MNSLFLILRKLFIFAKILDSSSPLTLTTYICLCLLCLWSKKIFHVKFSRPPFRRQDNPFLRRIHGKRFRFSTPHGRWKKNLEIYTNLNNRWLWNFYFIFYLKKKEFLYRRIFAPLSASQRNAFFFVFFLSLLMSSYVYNICTGNGTERFAFQ